MPLRKEQRQSAFLGGVLVVILVVIGYVSRERFLPQPIPGTTPLAPPRLAIPPVSREDALYDRRDFQALKRFGAVPVRPSGAGGSSDPFSIDVATP